MNKPIYPGRQQGEAFEESLCEEARDLRTSAARLRALSKKGGAIAIEVARNPSAPEALLRELSTSGPLLIKFALLQNPSLPAEVSRAYIGRSQDRLLRALVVNISDPEVLAPFALRHSFSSSAFARALAQNLATPYRALCLLAPRCRFFLLRARRALVEAAQREPSLLLPFAARLRAGEDPWLLEILSSLARAPETTGAMLAGLAGLEHRSLNLLLAKHSGTPLSWLLSWAEAPDAAMLAALVSNPSTPTFLLEALQKRNVASLPALAANPGASVSLLASLLDSTDNNILLALARNPTFPAGLLPRLLAKPSPQPWRLHWLIALRPDLPDEVLPTLRAQATDPSLRALLGAPEELRAAALQARSLDGEGARRAALDPTSAPALLACLLHDPRFAEVSALRVVLLRHPQMPPQVLAWIARFSSSQQERISIAQNPSAPIEALVIVALDPRRYVRESASARPELSRQGLSRLLNHEDPVIKDLARQRLAKLRPGST